MITDEQIKAARKLLNWSPGKLAVEARVLSSSVNAARGRQTTEDRRRIQIALEAAGIEFIEKNGGGSGVRLKEPET